MADFRKKQAHKGFQLGLEICSFAKDFFILKNPGFVNKIFQTAKEKKFFFDLKKVLVPDVLHL